MINRQLYRFVRRPPDNASLVLDFENHFARVNGKATSLADLVSVTRASSGGSYEIDGALIEMPPNQPRLSRRRGSAGLIIERQVENILLNGSNPTMPSWTLTGATGFFNNSDALDGSLTAGQVLDNQPAGFAAGRLTMNALPIDGAATWWTFAIPVRVSGRARTKVFLGITNGSSSVGGEVLFDTDTGAVISAPGGVVAGVEQLSAGYCRLIVSTFNSVGSGAIVAVVSRENDAAQPIFFEFDRAMVSRGLDPGTPIKAGASSTIRNADAAKVTVAGSDWYRQGRGTIMIDATMRGDPDLSQWLLTLAGPTGTGNLIDIARVPLSGAAWINARGLEGGSVTAFGSALGAYSLPRRLRVALSFASGSPWLMAVSGTQYDWHSGPFGNGVVALTGTLAAPVNVEELHLGHSYGTSFLDGVIHQVAYMPAVLDAAGLSALVS